MADVEAKETVQALRKEGMSIADIAQCVGKSKSTVSYWCRNIVLTSEQIKALQIKSKAAGARQFILLGEEKRKARLQRELASRERGLQDVGNLSKRDLFLLGLGLYWGEGYKHGNGELGFTNSDPQMILVFIKWLKEVYSVGKQDLILRVSINQVHREREREVIRYWKKLLSVSSSQFTKTSFVKTEVKKRYANHDNYYGILRVKVKRGSMLKQRILGSLEKAA